LWWTITKEKPMDFPPPQDQDKNEMQRAALWLHYLGAKGLPEIAQVLMAACSDPHQELQEEEAIKATETLLKAHQILRNLKEVYQGSKILTFVEVSLSSQILRLLEGELAGTWTHMDLISRALPFAGTFKLKQALGEMEDEGLVEQDDRKGYRKKREE
jgi:hypothetical protein